MPVEKAMLWLKGVQVCTEHYVNTHKEPMRILMQHPHKKLNDAYLPKKLKISNLHFRPKIIYPERVYGVKILKI